MQQEIYVYGKLNRDILLRDYSGKETDTANTIVDNANNTIEVNVKIDDELSNTSELPVQNKVVKEAIDNISSVLEDTFVKKENDGSTYIAVPDDSVIELKTKNIMISDPQPEGTPFDNITLSKGFGQDWASIRFSDNGDGPVELENISKINFPDNLYISHEINKDTDETYVEIKSSNNITALTNKLIIKDSNNNGGVIKGYQVSSYKGLALKAITNDEESPDSLIDLRKSNSTDEYQIKCNADLNLYSSSGGYRITNLKDSDSSTPGTDVVNKNYVDTKVKDSASGTNDVSIKVKTGATGASVGMYSNNGSYFKVVNNGSEDQACQIASQTGVVGCHNSRFANVADPVNETDACNKRSANNFKGEFSATDDLPNASDYNIGDFISQTVDPGDPNLGVNIYICLDYFGSNHWWKIANAEY